MADQRHIDALIDAFVAEQRSASPDPSLASRVLIAAAREKDTAARNAGAWERVVVAFSLVAAVALGIKAGNWYQPGRGREAKETVVLVSDDQVEHFRFYQQAINE